MQTGFASSAPRRAGGCRDVDMLRFVCIRIPYGVLLLSRKSGMRTSLASSVLQSEAHMCFAFFIVRHSKSRLTTVVIILIFILYQKKSYL